MRKFIILLLMSLCSGLSFAEEAIKTPPKPAKLIINLSTAQGTPTAAKLRILDTRSRPVLYEKGLDWLWIDNPAELTLKPGSYSLIPEGPPQTAGMR